jgi:CRP-like cAMP-binding protein
MPFSDRINNRLLLALPQEELDRLRPNLVAVDLPRGQMLLRPNELIDYVYFPEEGMVSLVLQLEDGSCWLAGVAETRGEARSTRPATLSEWRIPSRQSTTNA